jgi:CBS domain-containing protein
MNLEAGLFSSAVEIMSTPVLTVTPDTTIQEAVILLEKERISGVPVVDPDNRLLGMLTEFDLLRAIRNLGLHGHVREFMSTNIVSAEESDSLADLTDLMLEKRVRRMPVLRDGRVVGVISRRDLVFVGHVRQQLLADLPVTSMTRDLQPGD